jgi:uncharacterized membrane protein
VAELIGAVVSVVLLVIVFLPVVTFLRLARISRELEELSARVAHLETVRRPLTPTPTAPGAQAAPVPPVAPAPPVALGAPVAPAPVTPAAVSPAPVVPVAPGGPPALGVHASPVAPAATAAAAASSAPGADARSGSADGASLLDAEDLEERLGGRGLLYVGVLVTLLGVSFFLKYAFDNAWINETARTLLGALVGVGLVVAGLRFASRGLEVFGQALTGAGFAVLYLVVYAALNFYQMIDRGVAFALMIVITSAAALMADRQRAQSLAFLAVGGGLLTPALVGGDENAQLTLFSYVALLVLGTMVLSFRHQWLALNVLTYVGTFVTVVAWAGRHYTDDQWLRTLLFLTLFLTVFLIILRETGRRPGVSARAVGGLLSTAPVFYHLAAVIITAAHPPAIHIYLIAFTAAGLWLTADPHRPLLRLAILLAAFLPLFGTLTLPDGRSWLLPNIVTITSVAVLHVMGLVDRALRQEERLRGADHLALHLAGLGLFALLYESLQPVFPGFRLGLAALVALAALALYRVLRGRDEVASLHAVGLAFTLVAIGIGVQFDGATAIIGWAAEALAVTWLGVKTRQRGFEVGGLALWTLAAIQTFDSFTTTPAAFTVLVNARSFATIFVVVVGYILAWRIGESDIPESRRLRIGIHIIASVLTLRWLTAEIQSFWEVRYESPQAYLYEQMLLSLAWGLYGAALIAAGMLRKYAPLRIIGMVILAVTSLKVFFYDLWELGGIYRVIGFLSFGVLLVLVSYLYQNRRNRGTATAPSSPQVPEPARQPQSGEAAGHTEAER